MKIGDGNARTVQIGRARYSLQYRLPKIISSNVHKYHGAVMMPI